MPNTYTLIENLSAGINIVLDVLGSGTFWLGLAIGMTILICVWLFFVHKRYRTSKITLSIPFGLGNVVYDASDQDRILAWKMYVQLKTRKAALPFDDDHDLVANVYDSLHEVFPVTRDLLSDCCPHYLETQKSISDFVLRVLNDGIRPHLTRWHPLFRAWWEVASIAPKNLGKTPQILQREFPQYDDLVADLKKMNDELAKYAEELIAIVRSKPGRAKTGIKVTQIVPEQPVQVSSSEKYPHPSELPHEVGVQCNQPDSKEGV